VGFAFGWMAFGAAVLVGSWRMDRLESLHINPWSAPGLMPGVLGALMLLFGAALGLRELAHPTPAERSAAPVASARRIALALVLCFAFAAGLLGRGLPFWLVSAAFLFVAILAFRFLDRDAGSSVSLGRVALSTAAIALAAAFVISLVFENVFLVRLP
jgi:Tripartite tricarboxylate transporter TctB family